MQPKHFVTPEKTVQHAEMLANRVKNRYRHLARRFKRQGIDCFRLYDWDIPEVRAVVDWYAGHLVIAEYVRLQTGPDWLPQMAAAVAQALNVPPDKTHVKKRRTGGGEAGQPRYSRMGHGGARFTVQERDLKFWVNLDDFLDTGLYSDHRDTRMLFRELSEGKEVLNLFGYTGAFTCAAAAGGALSTVTVDRSRTYLKWAKENLVLNGLLGAQHAMVVSDAGVYLDRAIREGRRFTLAFVDPPSFFKDEEKGLAFDVNRDHVPLLRKVMQVMAPGSCVFFSTNHQRFEPQLETLRVDDLSEITPKTIPEDYRNRTIHRCWRMTVPPFFHR